MTSTGRRTSAPGTGAGGRSPRGDKRSTVRKAAPKVYVIPDTLSVKRLAEITQISSLDVIKQLMRNGIMASMNQLIDYDVATLVTSAFAIKTRRGRAGYCQRWDGTGERRRCRCLQHGEPTPGGDHTWDHGKTTLLDTYAKARSPNRKRAELPSTSAPIR